jgi:hypothetical protein
MESTSVLSNTAIEQSNPRRAWQTPVVEAFSVSDTLEGSTVSSFDADTFLS